MHDNSIALNYFDRLILHSFETIRVKVNFNFIQNEKYVNLVRANDICFKYSCFLSKHIFLKLLLFLIALITHIRLAGGGLYRDVTEDEAWGCVYGESESCVWLQTA